MKNTNAKLANIRRAAAFLRKALSECSGADLSLEMTVTKNDNDVRLSFHRVDTNFDATNIMRSLNIGERAKNVFAEAKPWHTLEGQNGNISARVFAMGLPSTCQLVEVVERVPKTQTVDTGEFIEVKKFKTVCG